MCVPHGLYAANLPATLAEARSLLCTPTDMRVLETEPNVGCTSERCRQCGKIGYAIVERVILGSITLQRCYCRACGASWTDQDGKSREMGP
jgi:hypothetical protein